MTPRAAQLCKRLMHGRTEASRYVTRLLGQARCYELSAVAGLINELAESMMEHGLTDSRNLYLPAEVVVLECDAWGVFLCFDARTSVDMLLEHAKTANVPQFDALCRVKTELLRDPQASTHGYTTIVQIHERGIETLGLFGLAKNADLHQTLQRRHDSLRPKSSIAALTSLPQISMALSAVIYAMLAIINTPYVTDKKTQPSHRGLQKQMAHSMRATGKGFKLQDWHKVIIHVMDRGPREPGKGGGPGSGSGPRGLHWCRPHQRVLPGKIVGVKGHYRGNPALGIIKSDFIVKP